jgi:hypothetical protein
MLVIHRAALCLWRRLHAMRLDAPDGVRDTAVRPGDSNNSTERVMPKFVIERDIPGAGKMSPSDLKALSQKSCGVLSSMGPSVQWVHSYVTDDKIYCIYQAADASQVKRHAELGGFPANKISRVSTMIDPSTAE